MQDGARTLEAVYGNVAPKLRANFKNMHPLLELIMVCADPIACIITFFLRCHLAAHALAARHSPNPLTHACSSSSWSCADPSACIIAPFFLTLLDRAPTRLPSTCHSMGEGPRRSCHDIDTPARRSPHARDAPAPQVEHIYGRVLSRPLVGLRMRELCTLSILAGQNVPLQMVSHLRGSMRCGATREETDTVVEQTGLSWGDEALAQARTVRDDTWAKEKRDKEKKAAAAAAAAAAKK